MYPSCILQSIRATLMASIVVLTVVTSAGYATDHNSGLGNAVKAVSRYSLREVTYTVHSCTCRGNWNCGPQVSGQVTSTTGQRFLSLSQEASQTACREDLVRQIGNACRGYGALQLNSTPTCSSEQSTTPPPGRQLPPSYTAPDGLIWGPAARDGRGNIRRDMNHQAAIDYCEGMGQRLPTKAEFETLVTQLGGRNNYNPDLVPDLRGNLFWSLSSPPGRSDGYAYLFHGREGGVIEWDRNDSFWISTRCVSRR